jgi:hypothetical protein
MAIPTGQEFTKIPIAVAISRPANQSVTIFDIRTFSTTPPTPAITRPAICASHAAPKVETAPPSVISANPARTAPLSPKNRPIAPPGSAITRPGDR